MEPTTSAEVTGAGRANRNERLEILLARARWSPENLADRLNELAAGMGWRSRLHRRTPRRWLYGDAHRLEPCVPRQPWPGLVCHLIAQRLGEPITPEHLGWPNAGPLRYVSADDRLGRVWDTTTVLAALTSVVDADGMERRHFLAMTGLSLTSVAHQWLFDPARLAASVMGTRVDHALVDDFERVADARRRMDDALGGGALLASVREDLRLVVALLNRSAYTEEVGRRLYATAAEFGRLAGWLADDCNQPALAQRYFLTALRAVHLSGDRAIGANILGNMCVQAGQSGNPREAMTLAESALTAGKALTPAVVGSLHGRLGLAAAFAGDAEVSRRARDRSFELLARSVPAEEPPWIYWFNQADAHALAGWSDVVLGRPTQAEAELRRAVALIDPAFARDRCGMLLDLATARLGTDSMERAFATATEAATIIRRLDSPRERRLLAEFRAAATPYAHTSTARDFDEKHRDLLGASQA